MAEKKAAGDSISAPIQHEENAARPSQPIGFIRQVELVDRVKAYDPDADEDLLNRAYVYAMKAHGGQMRASGDPYFSHPLAVAAILTELRADPATVATALLHDVVEDTDATVDDIKKLFGDEVARLVDGVTKLSQIELKSEASKQAENFRKLVVAMADDVRVLLVKLADRLHNMRTLHHIPKPEKRQRIAHETMEIYAPLAGRIGVHKIREELEDISFRELSQDVHATISERLADLQTHSIGGVVELANVLREQLNKHGIKAQITSREKRPYSIWRKMTQKNVSFDELADIYAFRVLVDGIDDCYAALGVIHTNWRMIPTEFDDYISAPKPNNYRSIHTAVIGPPSSDGRRQRIEIQIRTFEMHDTAERGVAAHWQYKDPGDKSGTSVEIVARGQYDPYDTPRRLVEMFQTGEDPDEALQYAKLELFQDQVFCFTPKSRVIALPKGATPLDFAYAVHTDVGDQCIGAKINGVQRPLRTPLNTGDVVEILRSDNAPVPAEWESVAYTGKARSAIRRRIKKMQYDEHLALGRSIAESVFTGAHLEFSIKGVREGLKRLGKKSVDDVLVSIGRGDLAVNELVEAVYPGASLESSGEIRVASLREFKPRAAIAGLTPGVSVKMARCCTPLPGERIVGIRQGDGGVKVHTIYCETLAEEDPPQDRWLDLKWREHDDAATAFARLIATVRNGLGVLSEIAGVIARYGVSIANIRIVNRSKEFVDFILDVEVKDSRQFAQMLAGVRASPNVIHADRTGAGDHDEL
ncbi:bifunctional (p)ppGpp synthetase/guanosine-3',5'-bis(diphosphate) 3'-pyrophosphohydrolase [Hyphococcus flavus]|uniref:GTP pyrophosphokinase rsh n=1 Tax=Hyphococcus flavus TaxID=1866326 RepID=A0AAE9ZDA6_9PROT|nr:bifunctional (p)ppGpp synthetase/guanosine-3',5'-bis(diphosphate) 3'-pyrophosphohydrolase [Hyphococcus flavus]WDI30528.1 bifunctional (p)ppGpp synthetase/guanosine-3',5'-bis(diphosphate) 3'-pyrophosphohydrolase [Hyphococcus flavus]